MKKVRWGIIGVGDVTEVKSGPAFNKVENSEVTMVMRRNLEKVKDYAERHSITNYTNNADDIFNNSEIDAVYIATPPSSHAEYSIKAANAKKHVYVEKPMATTYAECLQMIEAAEKNNVKLFVAYYRRELDYFKKIKSLIDEKTIGEIKLVNTQLLLPPNETDYDKNSLSWRVKKEIAGGGYFYDLASHQFDFFDYLFGPIKSAQGISTNQLNFYDVEDIVSASFLFEANIIGSGTWCFTMPNNERIDRTEIIGSEGKIVFSFFSQNPIELHKNGKVEKFEIGYPQHVQQNLIDSIVKEILGNGKCVSTGISGSRTNKILEEILT
ncbi:MAG: Gfo/Idh/MocA family oxidoreductase [Ignavibacteriae bacterium]|nr:Gfo/Idh/MocA family oxidoreductase [Ignavibacteriota bacterium]MCB9207098.1 Gfo/Idh/MocA family oxidoreductase [Ignavibacteriales bacterium]MCB9211193.1 Gfo/Idh/MocA family oxidoreductase [Ignavibacteriales bacterium]MCB9219444.1 Gfo/Idh/MocA family oxidoreductase [Ignavibacteriales bacterium]MCB9259882.1 Gfo/Idh/MocA family oxidoreductase [Ignavibacteriales bacterium]